jgi:hypothetical protein
MQDNTETLQRVICFLLRMARMYTQAAKGHLKQLPVLQLAF